MSQKFIFLFSLFISFQAGSAEGLDPIDQNSRGAELQAGVPQIACAEGCNQAVVENPAPQVKPLNLSIDEILKFKNPVIPENDPRLVKKELKPTGVMAVKSVKPTDGLDRLNKFKLGSKTDLTIKKNGFSIRRETD